MKSNSAPRSKGEVESRNLGAAGVDLQAEQIVPQYRVDGLRLVQRLLRHPEGEENR